MRRALLGVLVAAVAATSGCGGGVAGEATAPRAFDPCTLIDVGKLKSDGVIKGDFGLSRDVDPVDGRSDWCHAGVRGVSPVSVGVVVGHPFSSIDALVPSKRHQVSVGSDKGVIGTTEISGTSTLAVQHGDVQFMVTNSSLGDLLGKPLDEAGLAAVAKDMIGKLPQSIPDAPRDVPPLCDRIQGIGPIIGAVSLARGRATDVLTSCDFVSDGKHLLMTVTFTKADSTAANDFKTDNSSARLTLIPTPLFPGTVSRGHRDGMGLNVETLVDDRVLVATYYTPLRYNGDKYGTVTPGTTIGPDDRALISSSIDLARTLK